MAQNKKQAPRTCRICGCTDEDCSQCIERTGQPCSWVEEDLCSACTPEALEEFPITNNQKQNSKNGITS